MSTPLNYLIGSLDVLECKLFICNLNVNKVRIIAAGCSKLRYMFYCRTNIDLSLHDICAVSSAVPLSC